MTPTVGLLLVVALIAANGLFVAAEFGMVAARRASLEEAAAAGNRRAVVAIEELQRLSFLLSAAQFGITVTSLLVGFLAEGALGDVLIRPILELVGLRGSAATATSATLALVLATGVQMVVAELAPKNLAIARPEGTALALARPMRWFSTVFGPIVRLFDTAAAWASERVFGVEVRHELESGHSLSELSRIISASSEQGALPEKQAELLLRAVELGDTRLSEVMVARPDIVWLRADDTLDDLRRRSKETGHSRFPIHGEDEDDLLGTVHIKDLLRIPPERRAATTVAEVAADPLLAPESETVRRMIARFRRSRRTFAIVVDEYGGVAGLVTVEDLVERLVGEIEDEFDADRRRIRRLGRDRFAVDGALRADRAADVLGVELPEGEYETVAGFVIDRLGDIPQEGVSFDYDGWRVTVTRMDGARVAEIRLERRL